MDAVKLFHGGPTLAERAVSSVVGFMDEPRPMPSKVRAFVGGELGVVFLQAHGLLFSKRDKAAIATSLHVLPVARLQCSSASNIIPHTPTRLHSPIRPVAFVVLHWYRY